jgi:hypothetical protein
MNHRVLIAAGVSLGVHALFVAVLWLVPSPRPAPRGTPRGSGRVLAVRVEGWPVTRVAPNRNEEEYVPIDVQPTLSAAPVVSGIPNSVPGPTVREGPSEAVPHGRASEPGSSLFSAPASARRIVFVIDRSVSMGLCGGLQRARDELRAALRALPPDARFQVIAYNQAAILLLPDLLPAGPDTVERALQKLDALHAEGRTDHLKALKTALYQRPDVVFLVTDADDLDDWPVRLNFGAATLNVVELGRGAGRGEGPLARLARSTGGTYRRVAALP